VPTLNHNTLPPKIKLKTMHPPKSHIIFQFDNPKIGKIIINKGKMNIPKQANFI
jgi:hypothetical protein